MNVQQFWRRNQTNVGMGALAVIVFMVTGGYDSIQEMSRNAKELREQSAALQQQQAMLKLKVESESQSSDIAKERYVAGCVPVVGSNDRSSYTSIIEGYPILDPVTRRYIPAGVVVCDANGTTGRIALNPKGVPVVSDIAFTGDRAVITAALKKYQPKNYHLPQN